MGHSRPSRALSIDTESRVDQSTEIGRDVVTITDGPRIDDANVTTNDNLELPDNNSNESQNLLRDPCVVSTALTILGRKSVHPVMVILPTQKTMKQRQELRCRMLLEAYVLRSLI